MRPLFSVPQNAYLYCMTLYIHRKDRTILFIWPFKNCGLYHTHNQFRPCSMKHFWRAGMISVFTQRSRRWEFHAHTHI